MHQRSIRDGQSMFDVSLHAAAGRIADLRSVRDQGLLAGPADARRPSLRYALGVRLLAMGAALVADDPILPKGRLARG